MKYQTPIRPFKKIYIHPNSEHRPITQKILAQLPGHIIQDWKEPRLIWKQLQDQHLDPYGAAKQVLLLQDFKGKFVKKCPGSNTKDSVCCNYYVLNFMSQCPFDCSYCYLQDYLTNPLVFIYTNTEQMLKELTNVIKEKNIICE